jgi:hypothetical protein
MEHEEVRNGTAGPGPASEEKDATIAWAGVTETAPHTRPRPLGVPQGDVDVDVREACIQVVGRVEVLQQMATFLLFFTTEKKIEADIPARPTHILVGRLDAGRWRGRGLDVGVHGRALDEAGPVPGRMEPRPSPLLVQRSEETDRSLAQPDGHGRPDWSHSWSRLVPAVCLHTKV